MNFISFSYVLGKEERTPSDSQSNTSERPMIEVKKQKTQKQNITYLLYINSKKKTCST